MLDDASKKAIGLAVGVSGSAGVLWGLDPEMVKHFLSETAQSQIAQAGFFFTVAAWLHAGRVKKEIGKNFTGLTNAISDVSTAFRQDLEELRKILVNHSNRLDNLESTKPKETANARG